VRGPKAWAKRVLSTALVAPSDKRFVFVYHDISDLPTPHHSPNYSTTVSAFRAQVDLLARTFTFVPLDEVVGTGPQRPGRRLAAITFDDGFLSVKEQALPLLRSMGIPLAVFLNRRAVQENRLSYGPEHPNLNREHTTKVYLDEGDVKELHAGGVTVGSHSSSHRALAGLDEDGLREEVLENKHYLEALVATPIVHFALPFGKRQHYTAATLDYCFANGHRYVYSTNPTWFDPSGADGGPQLVPRVEISREPTENVYFVLNRPRFTKVDL
jgi:peptidoglycan/xylan/chitin deacetylase (PgdA/CDA1 family)